MIADAWIVFAKEVRDGLRDRRQLLTALVMLLVGPAALVVGVRYAAKVSDQGTTARLEVPATGAESAPGLVEYLRQRNIALVAGPIDAAAAVKGLATDVVLEIPPYYGEDFAAGRPARVHLVTDTTRTSAKWEARRVERAIEGYSDTVVRLRLRARGTNPSIVSAVVTEVDDVAPLEGSGGGTIMGAIPMLLLLSLFTGGLSIAVDVTAGERERASLEALMCTPASVRDIILGKLLAVTAFSAVASALSLAAFLLVVNLAPLPDIAGLKYKLDLVGSLEMLLALIPVAFPVAALLMLVASRGRSTKEAYTASSLFSAFVPTVPGYYLMLAPVKTTLALFATPVVGQLALMSLVVRGEAVAPLAFVVAGVSAFVVGGALAALAVGGVFGAPARERASRMPPEPAAPPAKAR